MVSVWFFFSRCPRTHTTQFCGFALPLSLRENRQDFFKNDHGSQANTANSYSIGHLAPNAFNLYALGKHKFRLICMRSNTFKSHNNKKMYSIRRKKRRCVNVKTKPRKTNILFLPYSVRRAFFYEV